MLGPFSDLSNRGPSLDPASGRGPTWQMQNRSLLKNMWYLCHLGSVFSVDIVRVQPSIYSLGTNAFRPQGDASAHLFFFFLFSAEPVAYGSCQARGGIGTTAAALHHSHSNTGFKPCLQIPLLLKVTPDP